MFRTRNRSRRAAQQVEREFGKIHFVMNNAGVVLRGHRMEDIDDDAWDWVLGTNLYGVIHGIQCFVPRIRAHGEAGHMSSTPRRWPGFMSAIARPAPMPPRNTPWSRCPRRWRRILAGTNIGVSVLTPAAVATEGYRSSAELRGDHRRTQSLPDRAGRPERRAASRPGRPPRARRHPRRAVLSDHPSGNPRLGRGALHAR